MELTWRGSNGAVKLHETQVSSASGSLYYCAPAQSTFSAIGDRILVQCMQTGGDWVQKSIIAGE